MYNVRTCTSKKFYLVSETPDGAASQRSNEIQLKLFKDTINCPEKVMKKSHFDQTYQRLRSVL